MAKKPKVISPIGGTIEEKIDTIFATDKKIWEIREQDLRHTLLQRGRASALKRLKPQIRGIL